MSDTSKNSSSGIGFLGLLTIVFITLKLTHFIDWSWWWILAPVWIPSLIVIILLVLVGLITLAKD